MSLVPGIDGGIGSGIRIEFKQIINFDLICLYSNVKAERFLQRSKNARLLARCNKLLKLDANKHEGKALFFWSIFQNMLFTTWILKCFVLSEVSSKSRHMRTRLVNGIV